MPNHGVNLRYQHENLAAHGEQSILTLGLLTLLYGGYSVKQKTNLHKQIEQSLQMNITRHSETLREFLLGEPSRVVHALRGYVLF